MIDVKRVWVIAQQAMARASKGVQDAEVARIMAEEARFAADEARASSNAAIEMVNQLARAMDIPTIPVPEDVEPKE